MMWHEFYFSFGLGLTFGLVAAFKARANSQRLQLMNQSLANKSYELKRESDIMIRTLTDVIRRKK